MVRWGDEERARLKDGERGRLEDEERGRVRWGDGEIGRISISLFSLLPSSDGHRTDIRYIRYIRYMRYRIRCRTSF